MIGENGNERRDDFTGPGRDAPVQGEPIKAEPVQGQADTNQPPRSSRHHDDLEDPERRAEFDAESDSFPMRQVSIPLWSNNHAVFNPVTSIFGMAVLWGVAAWCMVDPDTANAELGRLKTETSHYFTWFYIATQPLFLFFIFFIAWRFGGVKLSPDPKEEPEFSAGAYFAMLFSAGVAVGLFFYGVSEPLYYENNTRFANPDYHSRDEVDIMAMTLTYYHWGLAAWAPYLVVAIGSALASYRFGLPLTFRSCFYPVLGEYTWGWLGDLIDGFTIVTVVSGVCTSLGLGAMQLVYGLQRMGAIDKTDDDTNAQVVAIWVVTCVATVSVVSGLNFGIKFLSQLAFSLGVLLWFLVLALDNTEYVLNLMVQGTGYYFQYAIFQINFQTDAFAQLTPGDGRATDGKSGPAGFMNGWTVFYMAWWTAWSSFVGLFVARISRGRTIREVVGYSLVGPLIYAIAWFAVFGGVGIRHARVADELEALGTTQFGNATYYKVNDYCFAPPTEDVFQDGKLIYHNSFPGITPVCRLDSSADSAAWFNVLYSFHNYGPFLTVLSLIAIAIYFVTSSDSGSLIVDHLASNGHDEHHWTQRVFWAFTEGAVATALLVAGGTNGLKALQAASIIAGLPFTVLLCYVCVAIWRFCRRAERAELGHAKRRKVGKFVHPVYGGVFNIFEWLLSFGNIDSRHKANGIDSPTSSHWAEFFKALLFPFYSYYVVTSSLDSRSRKTVWTIIQTIVFAALFILWIALFASTNAQPGIKAFAWSAFIAFAIMLTNLRSSVRARYSLEGNVGEDFVSSLVVYPQVLSQMVLHVKSNEVMSEDE